MSDAAPVGRIDTIDGVRGFAVLGILLMNIVAFGLPAFAYTDPSIYGMRSPADHVAWALAFAVADGKMRMLFSMLFGASMALVADAARGRMPGPVALTYRRLAWLFLFGMIHAWLIWYGDILVEYALCGAIAFLAWRWPSQALFGAAMLLLLLVLAWQLHEAQALLALKSAALAEGAPAAARTAWTEMLAASHPPAAMIAEEIHLYRAGFLGALEARAPMTIFLQSVVLPAEAPVTIAFMLLGLLLLRTGYWQGAWPRRHYLAVIGVGYGLALPLHWPLVDLLTTARWDPAAAALADALKLPLRLPVGLAHAAAIILLLRSRRAAWLSSRLVAAGRMAFSNYLGTSLLATGYFYGLARFGTLSRAELYLPALLIWALILLWSRPWLSRFRYGPLEWLWRSLTRCRLQPIRINAVATRSQ